MLWLKSIHDNKMRLINVYTHSIKQPGVAPSQIGIFAYGL